MRRLAAETLRRHLQRHGADLEEATLGPCEGPKGLGMYARRPITKGEVVASVPRGLVLEAPLLGAAPPSDTLPLAAAAGGHGQWYDVLGSASGRRSAVKLAKRVVEEEEKGPKSPWASYLHALPGPIPPLHPLANAWPPELLLCSPFLARLYEEAEHCHTQCLSLAEPSHEHERSRLRRALSAVITRNFALQGPALALLPFLDFFNHCSATRLGSIDWTCSFHERHGSVTMVADRFITAGEELSFVYVAAPDAVLLVQYAMAPGGGNVHNMAGVQVFPEDVTGAMWEEKWRVLKQWGWNGAAPLLFTVPDALGPGAAPLRRLAELLAAEDGEVIAAVCAFEAQSRGRRRRHRSSSAAALRLLLSWLQRARRRLALPDVSMDCTHQELRSAVAAVVEGEAMVLESLFQETIPLRRNAQLLELAVG